MGHVPPSTTSTGQHQHHVTFSPTVGEIAPPVGQNDAESSVEAENGNRVSVKFVQDSSRFWYKPGISREQGGSERVKLFIPFDVLIPTLRKNLAMIEHFVFRESQYRKFLIFRLCLVVAIAALKEREPGTFLIRDSNSFQGAYGLALKVATPPPNVNNHNSKGENDMSFKYLIATYLFLLSSNRSTV